MSFHNLNEEDFGSDDSSDEDYVPCEGGQQVSEEEDSGEDESLSLNCEDGEESTGKKRGTKRRKNTNKRPKKLKASEQEEAPPSKDEKAEGSEVTEEANKKRVDALWADFLKDVGGPKKNLNGESTEKPPSAQKSEKVTIVKEYKFAGEIVRVPTVVEAGSIEAKNEDQKLAATSSTPQRAASSATSSPSPINHSIGRSGGSSGLSGLLDKLNKKPKMTILDKSKLDWNSFKSNEGIVEELEQHNRGKNGYLERVAFLQRADLRQYELERDLRLSTRKPT